MNASVDVRIFSGLRILVNHRHFELEDMLRLCEWRGFVDIEAVGEVRLLLIRRVLVRAIMVEVVVAVTIDTAVVIIAMRRESWAVIPVVPSGGFFTEVCGGFFSLIVSATVVPAPLITGMEVCLHIHTAIHGTSERYVQLVNRVVQKTLRETVLAKGVSPGSSYTVDEMLETFELEVFLLLWRAVGHGRRRSFLLSSYDPLLTCGKRGPFRSRVVVGDGRGWL